MITLRAFIETALAGPLSIHAPGLEAIEQILSNGTYALANGVELNLDDPIAYAFRKILQEKKDENEEVSEDEISSRFKTNKPPTFNKYWRPYNVEEGILRVPVEGVLLNSCDETFGGMITGYNYIQDAVEAGIADTAVKGILLDVDSPGGTVSGLQETIDQIESSGKPTRAIIHDSGYSAAYALSSATDGIDISKSGGAGSIGVVWRHANRSRQVEQEGVDVTYVYAGDRTTNKRISRNNEKRS